MTNRVHSISEVVDAILPLSRVIVIAHYSPDADAYGSSLGLAHGLRSIGKDVTVVNETGIIPRFNFLPGISQVVTTLPAGHFDAALVCDCGDEKRLGDTLKQPVLGLPLIINIDHHISNTLFGAINIVPAETSSTSEVIFELLSEIGRRTGKNLISRDVAVCLYAGISGDTGSFKYSSASAKTFRIAAALVEAGANPAQISEEMYGRTSKQAVLIQAEALSGLKFRADGKIATVVVNEAMFSKHGATSDDTEELVERSRDIEGVLVSVFLREEDGLWKASLRSRKGALDVASIATKFGGGGHKAAAGFRWRGTLEELQNKLFPIIESGLVGKV